MTIRAFLLLLVAVFASFAAPKADAQVLVYRLDFAKGKGINYHIFETGFFVAPLLGGSGSFLLATNEDGRIVHVKNTYRISFNNLNLIFEKLCSQWKC